MDLSERLGAQPLEVADVRYYGVGAEDGQSLMPTRDQVLRSAEFSEREDRSRSEFTFHNPRKSPKHEVMFGQEPASALAGGVHGRTL